MTQLRNRLYPVTAALCLLGLFAVRVLALDEFPLFIDEMLAIQRAEDTIAGDPLYFATQGKALLPWLSAPFITGEGEVFVVRYVTVLLVMLGASALLVLGKRLHSWRAGYLALVLLAFNPMLHFHDRLALADTTLWALLALFALALLLAFDRKRVSLRRCVLAGALFVGALLAKASAFVMLPLPVVAMVLLPHRWRLRERLKAAGAIYATMALLWVPFYGFALARGVDYFGRAGQGTSARLLDGPRLWANTAFMLEGLGAYLDMLLPLLLVGALVALLLRQWGAWYLLAWGGGFALALILAGGQLFHRYWLGSLPPFIVLLAVVVMILAERFGRGGRLLVVGVLLLWGMVGLPFIRTSYQQPLALALPPADFNQYLRADSAGTGLPQLAQIALQLDEPLVGAFIGCESLQYVLPDAGVDLRCVRLTGTEAQIVQRVQDALQQRDWLILEAPSGYISAAQLTVDLTPTETITRPGDFMTLTLYAVRP